MTENVPDTLSVTTSQPRPRSGQPYDRHNRRPRMLISGERANRPPEITPGKIFFRINPDPVYDPVLARANPRRFGKRALERHRVYARAVIRDWGLRNGYEVHARGKIPADVLAAFMAKHDIWSVEVVSSRLPKANTFSVHYHIRQGRDTKKRTIYPHVVKRELGEEMFNMLWEVRAQ